MATTLPTPPTIPRRARVQTPASLGLTLAVLGFAIAAAMLAGGAPVAFSIATVFLFAGPHNWFEARYMLGRLPARAGKLWGFFALSVIGILTLVTTFILMPTIITAMGHDESSYHMVVAGWNSLLLAWIGLLVAMRSRQNPRREWGWVTPVILLIAAGNWLEPTLLSITLIYLHPLMALWILDRELTRSRPQWRGVYHRLLMAIPLLIGLLVWHLHDAPNLPGDDTLTRTIAYHAGGGFFSGISTHMLVSIHTFLEMLHYGVWLVALPMIGLRSAPWRLDTIPAARQSAIWRRRIAVVLLVGVMIALTLWVSFLLDYGTTRQIYFTVALAHVLAEVPFLLRAL